VHAFIGAILAQAEEHPQEISERKDLYPAVGELIIGLLAFGVVFYFLRKWVLPRFKQVLDERREKIQGELEKAEATRSEADQILADYREQLAGARDASNRIIEEARQTADQLRRDLQAKADEASRATVARAQDEIRAERDRVFQELRSQVGEVAVELASRVVGAELDKAAHERLIDEYIDEVASSGSSGDGTRGS